MQKKGHRSDPFFEFELNQNLVHDVINSEDSEVLVASI